MQKLSLLDDDVYVLYQLYWAYTDCTHTDLDSLALNGWCGQSNANCLHFLRIFLVPILGWATCSQGQCMLFVRYALLRNESMTNWSAAKRASHLRYCGSPF